MFPEEKLKRLYELIDQYRGDCEVWFRINNSKNGCKIRSRSMRIRPDNMVLNQIKEIVGEHAVQIYGRV